MIVTRQAPVLALSAFLSLVLVRRSTSSFIPSASLRSNRVKTFGNAPTLKQRSVFVNVSLRKNHVSRRTGRLFMYNLPPSGGGKDDLKGIVGGLVVVVATIAFFASPLGAFFFAVFNSIFLLTLLIPVFAYVGFNVWQYFNTITGPCPSCGAPVRVVKSTGIDQNPSLCLNCGSVVQASFDNEDIEIASQLDGVVNENASFFNSFFGGETIRTVVTETDRPADKKRRERTVIDVDAEDEDPKKGRFGR